LEAQLAEKDATEHKSRRGIIDDFRRKRAKKT